MGLALTREAISMFNRIFKKKQSQPVIQYLVAQLNARLQPMHRGEYFEDPLEEVLQKGNYGEVSGGGTMQAKTGEIEYCDIEIQVSTSSPEVLALVISALEELGAPKGSKLTVESTGEEHAFGVTEGLAVYLNGTDLPADTYQDCDSNHVYDEFERLLEGEGRILSFWQGPTETALYMYGQSFEEMRIRISEFVATYPLCAQCRIEQIA